MPIIMYSQGWLCIALWCESTRKLGCDFNTYKILAQTIFFDDSLYH